MAERESNHFLLLAQGVRRRKLSVRRPVEPKFTIVPKVVAESPPLDHC